jgi:Co/Zn/Cd efflux system component
MMRGRLFWVIWLLVGCQLVWTAIRAFQAPWIWNPYQAITAVSFAGLAVGVGWLALTCRREGMGGLRTRIASLEAAMEMPGNAIALRWNIAFWVVAGALVFAYFQMEQGG